MQVVVQGLGRLGQCCIELSIDHPDVELLAVVTRRPGDASGVPDGVAVLADLDDVAARFPGSSVLHATHALDSELADVLADSARRGLDVVTSSALFNPATELADEGIALDAIAREHGARVVATGVQPGLVLDVLPATVLDLAPGWQEVTVVKPSDARSWPVTTRHMQGLGETTEVLGASLPSPLSGSARLLADSVGATISSLREERVPILAGEEVVLDEETIPAGRVVGYRQDCVAELVDGRTIRLVWEPRLDISDDAVLTLRIDVTRGPWLSLTLDGAFGTDPYPATAARMLHAAARSRSLPPGLHRVVDLGLAWGDRK